MDQTNQPAAAMPTQTGQEKKVGPIIAILVIVLVLIIAALYIFASKINQSAIPTDNSADQTVSDGSVPAVTGSADDVNSLQNDLNVSTQGLDNQNF